MPDGRGEVVGEGRPAGGDGPAPEPDLAAGDLSTWLVGMEAALRGERGSDVPCGDCTACCTSSQFVHVGPDETDALAHIPAALRFPAPLLPPGHVLLGYDERGHCPMLVDGRCSIYEHRPRACRTYDCRIFAATGVEVDEPGKEGVARRVRRWRFDAPEPLDRARREALEAASRFLRDHGAELPAEVVPANATQRAVLAVEAHGCFLGGRDGVGGDGTIGVVEPGPAEVADELVRRARARGVGRTGP